MKHETVEIPGAGDDRASDVIDRWYELKGDRLWHEQDWCDLARLMRPQRGDFLSYSPTLTHDRPKPLSSAVVMAANNFAAGLYGTMVNPTNRWFEFSTPNRDLRNWQPMKEWLFLTTSIVLASFRPSVSNFYSSAIQLMTDTSVFGNSAQYEEMDQREKRIIDRTLSLAEVCFAVDAHDQVDEIVRRFHLTPKQAASLFGMENLPEAIQEKYEKGITERTPYFQHVVRNEAFERGRIGWKGKAWRSVYVSEVSKQVVRLKGYDDMPFRAVRYEVDTGQSYGTGPGFVALASARMHHQMKAANLRSGQKAADPTLLAPDRETWRLHGRVLPGHTLYGGMNTRGQRMIDTLDNFGNTGLTQEMTAAELEEVREAFHWSLTNLVGRTGLGPIEALEMQEQRLRLQAPHLGRIQEEYLAPKIKARFALLWKAGQIPPPPEQGERAPMDLEYTSAAAMAQRSAQGVAAVRILDDMARLASLSPDAARRIDDRLNEDDLMETLVEARGGQPGLLRSREDADAKAAEREQMEQAAMAMEQAPQGAAAVRDLAQAENLMAQAEQGGATDGG